MRRGGAEFLYYARPPAAKKRPRTSLQGGIQLGEDEELGAVAELRLVVWQVYGRLPAARARLEPGDAIVAIDATPIVTEDDVAAALRGKTRASLSIERRGERRDVVVELSYDDAF